MEIVFLPLEGMEFHSEPRRPGAQENGYMTNVDRAFSFEERNAY